MSYSGDLKKIRKRGEKHGWRVEPVIDRLERDHEEFGPVISWDDDVARFVLALVADDFAHAASIAEDAINDALDRMHGARILTVETTTVDEHELARV